MNVSIQSQPIAKTDAQAIVDQIDTTGYAVIPNFISAEDIAQAQRSVAEAVRSNGNETVAVFDLSGFGDTFLPDLEADPAFIDLCHDVYRVATGRPPPDTKLVPSLRCLSGQSGQGHSMVFHYDTFVLTVILPIIIPTEGASGRFVLMPNTRPIRSSYLHNLLDKVRIDNASAQRRFHRLHAEDSERLRFIDMTPGNAYLLWGYRSVHTNEACDPDSIRSTAIFHYADPHADSRVKAILRR